MKKLILIFILYLFSFNANSQEWVNSLRNYWEANDIEGGIRLMERQKPTPYVLRHLASLYKFKLFNNEFSNDLSNSDRELLVFKNLTTLIEGGQKGDICNQYELTDLEFYSIYGIKDYKIKRKFEEYILKNNPNLKKMKYLEYSDLFWHFKYIFQSSIIKNKKYSDYYLKHKFNVNIEYACKNSQKITKENCQVKSQEITAKAAKLGHIISLNHLYNIEVDISLGKKVSRNYYNDLNAEQLLTRLAHSGHFNSIGNLSLTYLRGDLGIIQNYIKAHAYKLVALTDQSESAYFKGEWGEKRLTQLNKIKLPIAEEIKSQELATEIMATINKNKKSFDNESNPFEKICNYWSPNDSFQLIIPFKNE
jgi:hypothetical protein